MARERNLLSLRGSRWVTDLVRRRQRENGLKLKKKGGILHLSAGLRQKVKEEGGSAENGDKTGGEGLDETKPWRGSCGVLS